MNVMFVFGSDLNHDDDNDDYNVTKLCSCCYMNSRQIANSQPNLLSKVRKRVKATMD